MTKHFKHFVFSIRGGEPETLNCLHGRTEEQMRSWLAGYYGVSLSQVVIKKASLNPAKYSWSK